MSRAGARLDVEVLQDVVVDLGGDLLLLQHHLDGLVCSVGPDWRTPPGGCSWLFRQSRRRRMLTSSLC